jgi:acyl-CoA thioester hydrolase
MSARHNIPAALRRSFLFAPLFTPKEVPERIADPMLSDYPIRSSEKLRFADTDQQQHINNAAFSVYCQNARMELLCDPDRIPIPHDTQFVVVKLTIEFRSIMFWPGTVDIGTRIDRIGRSSVTMAQGLFCNGKCSAIAESIVTLMNKTGGKSVPLPEETIRALRNLSRPH